MNKKYHVYGIGNALVDIEFEVTDAFLSKYNVEKGMMTLVNEDIQYQLIKAIDQEAVVRKSGGSAANTVFALAQFGGNGFYSCKVANDEYGDFYLNDLRKVGIRTNLDLVEREDGITGKCLVMVTDDAERTMNTYLGITTYLSPKEIDEQAIKDSEYVYIEGYLVASDTGFEAMKEVKKIAEANGVKTSLTLSDPSILDYFKGRFHDVIGASVDLLFCNEEEALMLTEKSNLDEAREALKQEAKRFVITQGQNGAMIYDGETFIDIEAYPVQALDTNGAGDMFAGAFLYGLTHGHGYASSAKLASLAASKVVSQFGPRINPEVALELLKHPL